MPELDAVRAFAILPVLFFHSGIIAWAPGSVVARAASYGWAGVDLFFVLSGFLITGILLDARGSRGYFRNFYARRALRIWPLYYAALLLIFFVLRPGRFFPAPIYPFNYYATYTQNLLGTQYGPTPWAVTWSLAVEEQFYLVWPLLVWLCPRRMLHRVLVAMVLASPLLRAVAIHQGANQYFVSTFPLCRFDSLAMGALLACWVRSGSFSMSRLRRGSVAVFAGACALLIAGMYLPWEIADPLHVIPQYTLLAVGSAGLIGIALVSSLEGSWLSPVLRNPLLRYIGKISYGLYLLHGTVFQLAGNLGWWSATWTLVFEFTLLFLLMSASWRWFESPILRLKSRFELAQAAAPGVAPAENVLAPAAAYD